MSGFQISKYSNYREIDENKANVENKGWEKWSKDDRRKEYKYLHKYDNIIQNR